MPVFTDNVPEDEQIIDPPVGSTENNIDNSADGTDTPSTTVVTETKVTRTETVTEGDAWSSTAATDDPEERYTVSGSPWAVSYYRQILDKDDVTDVVNDYTPGPYQQYLLFKHYVLYVQDDLTGGEGEAIVLDTFVPTVGDHIVAALGDARKGMLKVESVTPTSNFLGRAYRITYKVISYTDEEFNTLNSRVVKTYYFDERLARLTRKSALTSSELNTLRQYLGQLNTLTTDWMQLFYDRDAATFIYTDATAKVYHPLLAEFVEQTFQHPLPTIKRYFDFSVNSIFTAIIERRLPTLTQFNETRLVRTAKLTTQSRFFPLGYTGVTHALLIDNSQRQALVNWGGVQDLEESQLNTMFDVSPTGSPRAWIPNLSTIDAHLFDADWYRNEPVSVLEELLHAWMTFTPINKDMMALLLEAYANFTLGEKFCYGPIIFFLARQAIKP